MDINYQKEVEKAVNVINSGGTIVYPTDTIWGIGCDATNPKAVEKVHQIKKRPSNKSFIVLLENDAHLNKYLKNIPEVAWDLLENITKPTTIIYSEGHNLAPLVIAEDGSVAIRIVQDQFCKDVIRKLNKPIVSTSANFSGCSAPQNFYEIDPDVLEAADYVVNLRQTETVKNVQSTIIKLKLNGEISFVRK